MIEKSFLLPNFLIEIKFKINGLKTNHVSTINPDVIVMESLVVHDPV